MARRTPLHDLHGARGARFVDFGGWDMPLHYGSQIDEHHAVRRSSGVFDVSHMCSVDVRGVRSTEFLRRLLANDVAKLKADGQALYSCMLNDSAGVIDDLIAYRRSTDHYRLVVNASRRDVDLAWIRGRARGFGVEVVERADLAMISIQGPLARERTLPVLPGALGAPAQGLAPFTSAGHGDWLVARTGYTGEDGFEVMLPATDAGSFWTGLLDAGVQPCGLGARDTLRLEAGLALYGNDIDETTHPLVSRLAWTVAFDPPDRDFVGRTALETVRRDGPARKLVGLLLRGRGVLRSHQKVSSDGVPVGEITSGTFAPTLARSIAFARVAATAPDTLMVDIRGQVHEARVVTPPFVRNGAARIPLDP